jgi:hypothetical protein
VTSPSTTEADFICEVCEKKYGTNEGTVIHGFLFHEFITRESTSRLITRGGFTPLSVWWCHSCFDQLDHRRARREFLNSSLVGFLIAIIAYLITLAASRDSTMALMIALGLGVPIPLISFILYLFHRRRTHHRAGRAHPRDTSMLEKRADKIARERGFTAFMTREQFALYNEDDRLRAMGLKY